MKQKNMICFAPPGRGLEDSPIKLCHDISRLSRMRLREDGEGESLFAQPGARAVLSFLAREDGVTQLELVRDTHLRAPTVSVMLRRFEEAGIVCRKRDEKDLRAVRVYLTERGREIERRNFCRIQKIDGEALAVLSEEEQATLTALLEKLRQHMLIPIENEEGEK